MKKRTYPGTMEEMIKKIEQNGDGFSLNSHIWSGNTERVCYGFIHFNNSNEQGEMKPIPSHNTMIEAVAEMYRESEAFHAAEKVRQSFVEIEAKQDE